VTHDIDEAIKLGDVVAVMHAGELAQFGPPAEILAAPASDFVARFVGADRGLKRLSLTRVRDLELRPAVTARAGDDGQEARSRLRTADFDSLLLLDEQERPLGWVRESDIPATGRLSVDRAVAMSPLLEPGTTLKDALSMMLDAEVVHGIVVDGSQRVMGLVTVDAIIGALRDSRAEASTA
jgi:osmoprotectant transport system ATP-binding protein